MNCENYVILIANKVFETLPKEIQEFLHKIMSTPTEAIDSEAEESAPEMELEVEVAAPEVAKVLAEAPKSPRTPRPKPIPTKETVKDKKGKKPTIPVSASPRRNPPKPTA